LTWLVLAAGLAVGLAAAGLAGLALAAAAAIAATVDAAATAEAIRLLGGTLGDVLAGSAETTELSGAAKLR